MDIALHIPDFWCGYIAGVASLFAVAVALGLRKGREEAAVTNDLLTKSYGEVEVTMDVPKPDGPHPQPPEEE